MADDESVWREIGRVRELASANEMRIAVLESQVRTLLEGVNASEKRLEGRIDDFESSICARLDRTRNTALALLAIAVPVISALVGALLSGGGS